DDEDYVKSFLASSSNESQPPKIVVYNNKVINFHAATICTDDESSLGSAILIRDVTEEKQLEKELRKMSFTDKLTGLYNRRHMEDILSKEFIRSRRYKLDMSLIFFDVDHFKKFNDTYGHDMGDRVLEELGKAVDNKFRDPDIPCRYGGEEFCVIMPNTNDTGAMIAAEKLRKKVESLDIDGVSVTITIGVASYPLSESKTPEELLKAADMALYRGKAGGRNRVVSWHDVKD
ncbi:MAG: GGDEF domain-containing protein, partial [Magnetococcales bacterium]|nr:GGDEF domain-containing protein [Magnetococcales bacterium]